MLLFLAGTVLNWLLTANYFGASLDEGRYLNGGQRIVGGELLNVDFFAFIGRVLYHEVRFGSVSGWTCAEKGA